MSVADITILRTTVFVNKDTCNSLFWRYGTHLSTRRGRVHDAWWAFKLSASQPRMSDARGPAIRRQRPRTRSISLKWRVASGAQTPAWKRSNGLAKNGLEEDAHEHDQSQQTRVLVSPWSTTLEPLTTPSMSGIAEVQACHLRCYFCFQVKTEEMA